MKFPWANIKSHLYYYVGKGKLKAKIRSQTSILACHMTTKMIKINICSHQTGNNPSKIKNDVSFKTKRWKKPLESHE